MYIWLQMEGCFGGRERKKICIENKKARLLEMKRMSGVLALEKMTEKRLSSLHFVALIISQHACQASVRDEKRKPDKKSQRTSETINSFSSAYRLASRKEVWWRKTCHLILGCVLSQNVHNRLNDKTEIQYQKVRLWKVTLTDDTDTNRHIHKL